MHLRFRKGFSLLNAIAHHHPGLAKDIGWYDAQRVERFPYLLAPKRWIPLEERTTGNERKVGKYQPDSGLGLDVMANTAGCVILRSGVIA